MTLYKTKIAHFSTQRNLFYDLDSFRFAYPFQQFQTNIMELDFLDKKIFGTTKVDRSSPTFTFLLPTRKDTIFKILNSEIVDPENHTGPVQLHIPGTRLGQIKECPSSLGIHKPLKRICFHNCHALAIILVLRFMFFLNDRGLFGTNLLLCCVYQQQHSPAGSWLCFSGIRRVHLMIPRPL